LIKEKSKKSVKFKKILNFTTEECIDKTDIVLFKKGQNKIEYLEYEDSQQISHGVLYREKR
jgi:hypothetical protein